MVVPFIMRHVDAEGILPVEALGCSVYDKQDPGSEGQLHNAQ